MCKLLLFALVVAALLYIFFKSKKIDSIYEVHIADLLPMVFPDYEKARWEKPVTEDEIRNHLNDHFLLYEWSATGGFKKYSEEADASHGLVLLGAKGVSKDGIDTSADVTIFGKEYRAKNNPIGGRNWLILDQRGADGKVGRTHVRIFARRTILEQAQGFVISEGHDSYHIQTTGTDLAWLTIFHCDGSTCTDLRTGGDIDEYTVEVLSLNVDGEEYVKKSDTFQRGDADFGRYRIFVGPDEVSSDRGYLPECAVETFSLRVTAPNVSGYVQKGTVRLPEVFGAENIRCGDGPESGEYVG